METKSLNFEQMENVEGGAWCGGNSNIDFWSGVAAGAGAILLFTPAAPLGGTILFHAGVASLLNHQCME